MGPGYRQSQQTLLTNRMSRTATSAWVMQTHATLPAPNTLQPCFQVYTEACSNRMGEKSGESLKPGHKIATQAPESYTHVNLGKEIPRTRGADPPSRTPTRLSSVASGRP